MQTFTFLSEKKSVDILTSFSKKKCDIPQITSLTFYIFSLQTKEESKSIGILFRQILSQNETSISMYRK